MIGLAMMEVSREEIMQVFRDIGVEPWVEMGNFRFCPTGEPYLTVCSAGVKPEGIRSELFSNSMRALDEYRKVVLEIYEGVKDNGFNKVIYWRKMPEMRRFPGYKGDKPGFSIYSRFRISNLPVIQSANWNLVEDIPAETNIGSEV